MTISHHMPLQNKLDASTLFLANFTWFRAFEDRTVLPTNINHNGDKQVIKQTFVNQITTIVEEIGTRKATYAKQVACRAWNRSHVRGHVKLVRAASSHYATMIQNTRKYAKT